MAEGYLAGNYDNVWLVNNRNAFHEWAYRSTEHSLVTRYFPIEEQQFSDTARLVQIYPYQNHRYTLDVPQQIPYQFGDNIYLRGYDFPAWAEAGATLPVALVWDSEEASEIDVDYNVGVFLINSEGQLVAERNATAHKVHSRLPLNGKIVP